jgi:nitrite reductase/ring-hydroxylating ferredoxin subunit
MNMLATLPIDAAKRVQLTEGPDGLPLIIVKQDATYVVSVNNCPDENLPLNAPQQNVVPINPRGDVLCVHHKALFNSCTGCLVSSGKARHVDRLAEGLQTVPVVAVEDSAVTVAITPEIAAYWQQVRAIRFRKSFGRGPVGALRHLLAKWCGEAPAQRA